MRTSPFTQYNPLKRPSGSVTTANIRVGSSGSMTIAPGSTTDTTNYTTAAAVVVRTTTIASAIRIIGSVMVKHSVASGQFDLLVAMYHDRAGSSGVTLLAQGTLTAHATADRYELVPIVQEFLNNQPAFPLGIFTPGEHLLALFFKNRTAGTLTWGAASQNNTFSFSEIGSGYAIV